MALWHSRGSTTKHCYWVSGYLQGSLVTCNLISKENPQLLVGETALCNFPLSGVPHRELELLLWSETGAALQFLDYWNTTISRDGEGKTDSVTDHSSWGVVKRSLKTGDEVSISIGLMRLSICPVSSPAPLVRNRTFARDFTLYCFAAILLCVVASQLPSPSPKTVSETHKHVPAKNIAQARYNNVAPTFHAAEVSQHRRKVRRIATSTQQLARRTHQQVRQMMSGSALVADPASASAPSRLQRRAAARQAGILQLDLNMDEIVEILALSSAAMKDPESLRGYGKFKGRDTDKATGAWGHGITKMGPGSNDGKDWGSAASKDFVLAHGKALGSHLKLRPRTSKPPFRDEPSMPPALYDELRGRLGMMRTRIRQCFTRQAPESLALEVQVDPGGTILSTKATSIAGKELLCVAKRVQALRLQRVPSGTRAALRIRVALALPR